MKSMFKNRFIVWMMWLLPISLTGIVGIIIWTTIQIMISISQANDIKIPFEQKAEIKMLNNPKNWSDWDMKIKSQYPNAIKIDEGVWSIE